MVLVDFTEVYEIPNSIKPNLTVWSRTMFLEGLNPSQLNNIDVISDLSVLGTLGFY